MQEINIDEFLTQARRVHFIGIGGSGMCPLAEILLKLGHQITGSDHNESETLTRVRKLGIPVRMGQSAAHLGDAELVVFTAALLPDNPELVAAHTRNLPVVTRSKLLGAITRRFALCTCIAGTHGKTTTTAMLAQILLHAGKDPSAVIGGRLPLTNSNALLGQSEHMVCEACEYQDTFLELSPETSVILNIDRDHMEYFKTLENLIASFRVFAQKARRTVLYNGDDCNTRQALEGVAGKRFVGFGRSEGCQFRAANVTMNGAFASFDLIFEQEFLTKISLEVPGEHNVLNALAAIAAAMMSGVSILDCEVALKEFRGAGRRFEILGETGGFTVADDYAHHPAELLVTLKAAKQMGFRKIWAVFQPFTFSRTAQLLDEFAAALSLADHVVLTEIMAARERNTYNIRSEDLAAKCPGSVCCMDFEEVARYVKANAQPGDLVITLGCGDVYKAAKLILL